MRVLFLATYFPRPLNPTIGTWALEQAKAFQRASVESQSRGAGSELLGQADNAAGRMSPLGTSNAPLVTKFRAVSGNPWFPKWAGRLSAGMRVYSECPRTRDWDGVQVDYVPMLYYPFGKLDAVFNRVGEPLLLLGWFSLKPRLMKIVREFQPDVVYAHHTIPNGYFALRLKQETGIPFVVTDHEMGEITACEKFPARRAVYDEVTESAFRMVSIAGVMRRDVERVFPQARCETIYNGIGEAPQRRGGSVSRCFGGSVEAAKLQQGAWSGERGGGESGDERAARPEVAAKGEAWREPESAEIALRQKSEETREQMPEPSGARQTGVQRQPRSGIAGGRDQIGGRSRGEEVKSEGLRVARAAEVRGGSVVVFSCGMFYGRKNFPGLIQAFNVVAEKYPHVVLRIAGDGPDRQKVEAEWKRSPFKDRIELMGKLSHEDVLQEMRKADVFALIGWREPFGVVFLEAMAAGLPVIACSDAGVAEVITGAEIPGDPAATGVQPPNAHQDTGVLVPPMDISAAARALEFLILNPVLRKEIGAAARRKVEAELTWDAVIGKYVQVFREAVAAESRGASVGRWVGEPVSR